ncbi:MAG: hypothetical protein Q4C69_06465 [Lachnoclostridium edouardi]|uniref:hypothetical protein n=1 Tax=Lachnoclostridium edouardi TaxID=1926283 RepID=UPI0026DBD841|nr:hypothetical protein [Lachnoclostridium edouardi]MDO4278452.1 hypothetical protein [Lachnoclostridium edouardi]
MEEKKKERRSLVDEIFQEAGIDREKEQGSRRASEVIEDLEDYIESQGIYLRQ